MKMKKEVKTKLKIAFKLKGPFLLILKFSNIEGLYRPFLTSRLFWSLKWFLVQWARALERRALTSHRCEEWLLKQNWAKVEAIFWAKKRCFLGFGKIHQQLFVQDFRLIFYKQWVRVFLYWRKKFHENRTRGGASGASSSKNARRRRSPDIDENTQMLICGVIG